MSAGSWASSGSGSGTGGAVGDTRPASAGPVAARYRIVEWRAGPGLGDRGRHGLRLDGHAAKGESAAVVFVADSAGPEPGVGPQHLFVQLP